jgi:N-acetylneuraminic acid mutarotase
MMRYVKLLLFILLCHSANAQLVWEPKPDIPGVSTGRWGAYCFSLNDKIYIAGGYAGGGALNNKRDFWEYDPATEIWTQKPDVPGGTDRTGAIAFAIGGKGYIGLGSFDVFTHPSKTDLWEYDPVINTWTKKADLPDTGRKEATCFVVNNKAYVVGGSINYTGYNSAHVWEYDPQANKWTAKKDYPTGIENAQAFTINNTGFVTGGSNNSEYFNTTYQYDPVADDWIKKANQCGDGRTAGVAFTIGSNAYVGLGISRFGGSGQEVYNKDFCRYDMATDTWSPAPDLPAAGRAYGIACVAKGKAYVGAGFFFDGQQNYLKDWHAFGFPTVVNDAAITHNTVLYPNPANRFVKFSAGHSNTTYTVYDVAGRNLLSGKSTGNDMIDVSALAQGWYIVEISQGGSVYKKPLMISR